MHPSHRSSLRPLFLLPTWLLAAAAHAANSVEAAAVPDDPAAAQAPARALSLAEAEATALRQQPLMRQSRGQTSAAEGRVEQARAGYLPQVSASALYERTTANPAVHPGFANNVSATLAPTSTKTFNFFNFGINGSQLIYDFGQTDGRWRSQEASRDAAQPTSARPRRRRC
jgi:outer membrane protein